MKPLPFHLTFRAVDSRVLAPDVRAQRLVAQVVHRLGERRGLLAFRAAGDHLHIAADCDRADAGKLARSVAGELTQRLGLPGFAPTHFTPCLDQRHVEETFLYVLRNAEKHGVTNDPAHEASSIGALLGLRLAPGAYLARVRRAFPSLDRGVLLNVLGVRTLEPVVQLAHLADAAAGAVGLAELDRSDAAFSARVAAVHVSIDGASLAAIAAALDVSERTARRYREAPEDRVLQRAIGLRMGLRAALGDRARVDAPAPSRSDWRPGRLGLRGANR
ncbi:MAG: hypothetical protein Q8P18_17660 [Pseudomonadota bacterium]|nr:hypothetical protein [Pseudomonadota bacterium]